MPGSEREAAGVAAASVESIAQEVDSAAREDRVLSMSPDAWAHLLRSECACWSLNSQNSLFLVRDLGGQDWRFEGCDNASKIASTNIKKLLRTKYMGSLMCSPDPKRSKAGTQAYERCWRFFSDSFEALVPQAKLFNWPTDEEWERMDAAQKGCDTGGGSAIPFFHLPPSCVAFDNGVYDFLHGRWLFRVRRVVDGRGEGTWTEYGPVDTECLSPAALRVLNRTRDSLRGRFPSLMGEGDEQGFGRSIEPGDLAVPPLLTPLSERIGAAPADRAPARGLGGWNPFAVQWHMTVPFNPGRLEDLCVAALEPEEFYEAWRTIEDERVRSGSLDRNMCFELVSNMAHDQEDQFDIKKFEHICEIMGYMLYSGFLQNFVVMIGEGKNGKDSLFSACFGSQLSTAPAAYSLRKLQRERFLGSLARSFHNISSETERAETTTRSGPIRVDVLKQLTGSEDQMLENKYKDVQPYKVNLKWLFSCNDVNDIRFADTSQGFLRRKNFLRLFWSYDSRLLYMRRNPDYYDTTMSPNGDELRTPLNAAMFCYLGMLGIKKATNGFSLFSGDESAGSPFEKRAFSFTQDDFVSEDYSVIDTEMRDKLGSIPFARVPDEVAFQVGTLRRMKDKDRTRKENEIKNFVLISLGRGKSRKRFRLCDLGGFGGEIEEYVTLSQDVIPGNGVDAADVEHDYEPSPFHDALREASSIWFDLKFWVSMCLHESGDPLRNVSVKEFARAFPHVRVERLYANRAYIRVSIDASGNFSVYDD